MVATRVGGVRRVVCGSPSYFSAHGIPRTPADLADLTCVTFANLAAGTSWSFASRSKDLAQAPRPRCRLTINTAEAAIAGIGITHVLSYQVAQAISEGDGPVEGFAIPVHRALTEPILLGGAPRAIAIVNCTVAAALGLGLRLWIAGLLIWAIGHAAAVWAAKRDPLFAKTARRHLRIPTHLNV